MHQGVRKFIDWLEKHRNAEGMRLNPPVTSAEVLGLEHELGTTLPEDLKLVLAKCNGGHIPGGELLPAGTGPGTMHGELRAIAKALDRDLLDPEIILPFLRADDGTWLAFDRGTGPLPDTWQVVDFFAATGDVRPVYHSFDSWCRGMLARWDAPDFGGELTLERYLSDGLLHAELEPDVASAHATVAHAHRRLGRPDEALASYLTAGRCPRPLAWVDWDALKLATLLGRDEDALEAAARLTKRAPQKRWRQRETNPVHVADVIGIVGVASNDREAWIARLEELLDQVIDPAAREHIERIRTALQGQNALPAPATPAGSGAVPKGADAATTWENARVAYLSGQLRDDHMLLDVSLRPLGPPRKFVEFLRLRREF